MCGCRRLASMRASRRKRSAACAVASSGRSTLIATAHSSAMSRPRNTIPMPPLAISRSTSYSGARAARSRSRTEDMTAPARELPAGRWKSQPPPASPGAARLTDRPSLLHGDRDMHPERHVRQAVPAVLPRRRAGEGHVVVLVRLREDRDYEVAHRVHLHLIERVHTALWHRAHVEHV